jgi:hypothetical protein
VTPASGLPPSRPHGHPLTLVAVAAGNGGLSSVKVGDQVSLTATVRGSATTVTSMIDLSRLGNRFFGPGDGNHGQPSG